MGGDGRRAAKGSQVPWAASSQALALGTEDSIQHRPPRGGGDCVQETLYAR